MCRLERWSIYTLQHKIAHFLYERTAVSNKPDELIARNAWKCHCNAAANPQEGDPRRARPDGDEYEAEVVRRFAARFKEKDWPGRRLPELCYDPRSVDLDPHRRASLHAKCIVVDEMQAFISSANFTEAARLRNIEVGVLIRSPVLARQLIQHFETLAAARILKPIPLG